MVGGNLPSLQGNACGGIGQRMMVELALACCLRDQAKSGSIWINWDSNWGLNELS